MKAFVKDGPGPGNAAVREVPDPQPGPGEAVIAVRYAGLCHTDVSMLHWNSVAQASYRPRFPLVMGHEYAGTVVALGPGADGPEPGTRVAGSAHVTCGSCTNCRRGRSMLCERLAVLGLDVAGVFAEYAAVPARNLVPLTDDVSDTVAAIAEPYAVAAHAVATGAPVEEETVAIVGPGAVGLCATAAARHRGVRDIAMYGLPADAAQLAVARDLGATATYTEPADGAFDLVIEAAGHPEAVALALRLCRPGGRVITAGLPSEPLSIDTANLARTEKTLTGVRAYDLGEWPAVPAQLAAAPALAGLVTHTLGLADVPRAVDLMATRQATRTAIDPSR